MVGGMSGREGLQRAPMSGSVGASRRGGVVEPGELAERLLVLARALRAGAARPAELAELAEGVPLLVARMRDGGRP
jgi:hypothetical protein